MIQCMPIIFGDFCFINAIRSDFVLNIDDAPSVLKTITYTIGYHDWKKKHSIISKISLGFTIVLTTLQNKKCSFISSL